MVEVLKVLNLFLVVVSNAGRSKGGQTRAEQLGHDGYVEMGKKGGSATN